MFTVEYVRNGKRRVVPFTMGIEALRFAQSIRSGLKVRGTSIQVRAPWGAYLPQGI